MAVPSNFNQLKEWFAVYTLSQKVAIAGSAALAVVLLWTVVYFVNQVEYQILYSELNASDAQGVVERLQAMSIDYDVSDDGSTIRVSRDRLSEARIQLASEGLPSSGRIGFEIFDRTNFGLTNFQEQVNFQRALEGELARSIVTLSEVDVARVHLVLPSDSLFRSDRDETKASVILRLRRGQDLNQGSVDGIVHLVASSVKGLEASRVTVVDYSGRMLTRDDGGAPVSGQEMELRMGVEADLSGKITRILEPVVGFGKVRPQVSVELDWQQVEETLEQYDPAASVVRSQQRRTERTGGAVQGQALGVPGPLGEAIDPVAELGPAVPGASDFLTEDQVVNFEVSKSVRHIIDPTGEIQRMSVAVIIDNKTRVGVDDQGAPALVSEPWTPTEMTQYRDLVAATVGFAPERGDTLIVENVPFGNEPLPIEPTTMIERQAPLILMGLRYLVVPVVFLIAYLLFLRPLQKTIFAGWEPQRRAQLAGAGAGQSAGVPPMTGGLQTPYPVGRLEQQLSTQPLPALPGQEPGAAPNFLPGVSETAGPTRLEMTRSRIIEHARKEPEATARLVRSWLKEDSE